MTDHPSSDRDELVAAYLDGEATPAERAVVDADPELMARVEILGEVMAMVGEPVMPPPPEVKRAHIAAALEASATAPNVTSMANRRRRFGAPQMAAAAAVVVALFAIPVILTSGDDDRETAAVTTEADNSGESGASLAADGAAASDDGADDGAEAFAAEEPAEEPAFEAAEALADEEPQAESDTAAEESAEEAGADQADDEATADADESADDAFVVGRLDIELAPTLGELALQVLPPPAGTLRTEVAEGTIDDLNCVVERVAEAGADEVVLQAGQALVGNQFVQYAVVERLGDDTPVRELVVFDEICAPIFTDLVE